MKTDHIKQFLLFTSLILSTQVYTQSPNSYSTEINNWHTEREESLKKENGWLNLAGLFWLKQGRNTFGSDSANDLVFPKGTIPAFAGHFDLNGTTVTLSTTDGVSITANHLPVNNRIIFSADSVNTPLLTYGSLRWSVIKREEKIGIRLRDLNSPALSSFKGINRYPVDVSWKINAVLETAGQPGRISITNVLGQTNLQNSAGKLVFTLNGKTCVLDVLDEGDDELFVIFADVTNTAETYPSGRFLYIKRPDSNGHTEIDFNKAYNPPCAFTPFATCPLPPPQNRLNLAITAGEKRYDNH